LKYLPYKTVDEDVHISHLDIAELLNNLGSLVVLMGAVGCSVTMRGAKGLRRVAEGQTISVNASILFK
jgi:hypothetical protein